MNVTKLKRYIRRINSPAFEQKGDFFKKRTATYISKYENTEEFKKILKRNEAREALKEERNAAYEENLKSPEYQEKYVWARVTPRK